MHAIVNSIGKVVFDVSLEEFVKEEVLGMVQIKSGNEKFGSVIFKWTKQEMDIQGLVLQSCFSCGRAWGQEANLLFPSL